MKIGTRVRIKDHGGMPEFRGKRGVIIGHEKDGRIVMNRVHLDEPVTIPGVGLVTDDLWANEYLSRRGS